MLQERFVVAVKKPIPAEKNDFKLPLEILLRDPAAEMVLPASRGVYQVPDHAHDLCVIADQGFPVTPFVVQCQVRGKPTSSVGHLL